MCPGRDVSRLRRARRSDGPGRVGVVKKLLLLILVVALGIAVARKIQEG